MNDPCVPEENLRNDAVENHLRIAPQSGRSEVIDGHGHARGVSCRAQLYAASFLQLPPSEIHRIRYIPIFYVQFCLPSIAMSNATGEAKRGHTRQDTALMHGLSTTEVQKVWEACDEAKSRAYCAALTRSPINFRIVVLTDRQAHIPTSESVVLFS